MTLSIRAQFAFPGGKLQHIDSEHAAYIHGNGIAILNLSSGAPDFVNNVLDCRLGISAFATNAQQGLVAFAPRSTTPSIHVISFPRKESKSVLRSGTDLEYETLAISQDAEYLCGISGPFDHHLYLWSLSRSELVTATLVNVRKETPYSLHTSSFNPRNHFMISTMGSQGLFFWKVEAMADDHQIRRVDATAVMVENEMLVSCQNKIRDEKDVDDDARVDKLRPINSFHCQCWLEGDMVVAVNRANNLMEFDAHSGSMMRRSRVEGVERDEYCIFIAVVRGNILLTFSDGTILGIDANKFDTTDFKITANQEVGVKFLHGSLTPHSDQLVMTAAGKIVLVPLNDTDESEYKQSPSAQLLGDYHNGPILMVASQMLAQGQTDPVLVTSGLDGCLRVWGDSGNMLCKHTFRQTTETGGGHETSGSATDTLAVAITALAVAPHDSMVAVGTEVGSLHLVYLISESQGEELSSIYLASLSNLQLSHGPLNSIVFHPSSDLIATTCGSALYIIEVSSQKSSNLLTLLAHTTVNVMTSSFIWHGDILLVSCIDGTIHCLSMSGEEHLDEFNLRSIRNLWATETKTPFTSMVPLDPWCSGNDIFVCGASPLSSQVVLISLPNLGADTKFASSTVGPSHLKGIVFLKASPCGRYLATGGADGRLNLLQIPVERHTEIVSLACVDLHIGAILCLDFARNKPVIYSTGVDGSVFGLNLPVAISQSHSPRRVRFHDLAEKLRHVPIRAIPAIRTTWQEAHEKKIKESAMLEAEAHKAVQRNVLADLRRRLQELLAKNEVAPEMEKMDREDFVVDVTGRENILAASRSRARELEVKLQEEDKARGVISARIHSECWDSMEVQATECRAFQSTNIVASNFPMKRRTDAEMRRINCIRVLRKLELRDVALHCDANPIWPRNRDIIPADIAWILNQGELRPVFDVTEKSSLNDVPIQAESRGVDSNGVTDVALKDSVEGAEDEEEEDADIGVREEAMLDVDSLLTQLYPPLALQTSIQKRTQQVLLADLIRHIKMNFNSRYHSLYEHKRNEMDRIGEKNSRIGEILSELGSKEDYFKPVLVEPDETPDVVIKVRDSEISCMSPDVEAARIMRQKAEEQRERLVGVGDNAEERALQDMMYGTLETKKDSDLFQTELKAPTWIGEIESMELTDSQRKEMDEYISAKNALEQHQEKYRKALELEFKKLRTEVADITRNFDDRVKSMCDQRVVVMNAVMTQELYLIRIGVGMLEHESEISHLDQIHAIRSAKETEYQSLEDVVSKTGSLVEAAAEQVEVLQSEDKLLERNFKRDLQLEHQLDQENFKIVLNYYRDRRPIDGTPQIDSTHTGPTAALAANPGIMQDAALLDVVPESFKLDEATWSTLQMLRRKKILKEDALGKAIENHSLLKTKYETTLAMLNEMSAEIVGLETQQMSLKAKLKAAELNTEILVRVRQGQDELEQEAVVTEYSDAVLLPVQTINVVNEEICRLGAEQVKILNKIKHFRKSINFMEWENRYMKEQSHDLEEYYTDLQLLHVTKNLQSVMKGDQSNSERERIAKAEARVAIMSRVHEKKCSKITSMNSKFAQQIRGREEENERLKQQLNEIGDAVSVREAIVRSRLDSSTGEVDSERRTTNNMKRITLRRRLIDLARLQTEEIDFLRQELDRLRQRTFPSFAHATRDRLLSLPDDSV